MLNEDYLLSAYDYELPESLIAQQPPEHRGDSRLLIVDKKAGDQFMETSFKNLADYLPANSLLVLNNTRVIPARLLARKATGGKARFLLLTPLPLLNIKAEQDYNMAECAGLVSPAGRVKPGKWLNAGEALQIKILEKYEYGQMRVLLRWQGDLEKLFQKEGEVPLPPYIRRPAREEDVNRYQTVFASKSGAVAAPTAGLHFTKEHMQTLEKSGLKFAETTLHVGYGTFTPVRCEDIREHKMHEEYVEISSASALAIKEAKENGRAVIAVGTTALRALEGMWNAKGCIEAFSGWTNIFIYPGKKINVADALITNFHLPKSSLLMLVSAMTGRKKILAAYRHAIDKGFLFFSYGDAMLIR